MWGFGRVVVDMTHDRYGCTEKRITCMHRQQLARRCIRSGYQRRNLHRITKTRPFNRRNDVKHDRDTAWIEQGDSFHSCMPILLSSFGWQESSWWLSANGLEHITFAFNTVEMQLARKLIHAENRATLIIKLVPRRSPCDRHRTAPRGTNESNVTQRSCSSSPSTPKHLPISSLRFLVTNTWSFPFTSSLPHPFSPPLTHSSIAPLYYSSCFSLDGNHSVMLIHLAEWTWLLPVYSGVYSYVL